MQNRPQPLTDNNLTGALRLLELTDARSAEHSKLLELIVSYFQSNQHEYQKALTAMRLEDRPAVQQYLSRANFISNYRELTISIVKFGNTKLVNTIVNILKFNVATRIALRKLMSDLLTENTDLSLKTFEYILRNNPEIDLNEKLDTLKSKNQPSSLLSLVVLKLIAEASLTDEADMLRIFNTTMYLQATLRILRLSFSDEAQGILTDMRNIKSDNSPLYNLAHVIIHIFEKEMDREVKLNGLCEVVADLKLCEQSVANILPEALLSNIVNKYTQDLNFDTQPSKDILLTHQGFQKSLSQFLQTEIDHVDHPILLKQLRDYFEAHHDLYQRTANLQVITSFKPSGSATARLIQDNYSRFQLSILETTEKNISILIELIPILMSIHQGSESSPQLNRLTLLSFAFDGAPALLFGFKFILRHYAHLNLNQPLQFSEHLNDRTSLSKTICSAALNTFNEYKEGNQSYQQVIQIVEFLKASIELDTLAELESTLAEISIIYEGKIPPAIITDMYAAAINKADELAAAETTPQPMNKDECQPFITQSRHHLFQPHLSGPVSPITNDEDLRSLAAKAAAPQRTI